MFLRLSLCFNILFVFLKLIFLTSAFSGKKFKVETGSVGLQGNISFFVLISLKVTLVCLLNAKIPHYMLCQGVRDWTGHDQWTYRHS